MARVFIPSRARGPDASARCALCGLQLAHLDPPSSWANFSNRRPFWLEFLFPRAREDQMLRRVAHCAGSRWRTSIRHPRGRISRTADHFGSSFYSLARARTRCFGALRIVRAPAGAPRSAILVGEFLEPQTICTNRPLAATRAMACRFELGAAMRVAFCTLGVSRPRAREGINTPVPNQACCEPSICTSSPRHRAAGAADAARGDDADGPAIALRSLRLAKWPDGVCVDCLNRVKNIIRNDEAGIHIYCRLRCGWRWNRVNYFGRLCAIARNYT